MCGDITTNVQLFLQSLLLEYCSVALFLTELDQTADTNPCCI